jgi:hypothetical protein
MDSVKAVGLEVVREAARASDPRNRNHVLGLEVVLAEHALKRGEDPMVAASLTPSGLLGFVFVEGVCFDLADLEETFFGKHGYHRFAPSLAASLSAGLSISD